MRPFACALLILSPLLATTALADPLKDTVTEGNSHQTVSQWLGEKPHLVIKGSINGYSFDVEFFDFDSDDIAEFEGKREYLPQDGGLRYADFEFTIKAVIAGLEKEIELEFENFDFNDYKAPADFTLQSEEFPKGALSNLEVEFEWEASGTSVNEEVAGWDGTLTLAKDDALGKKDPFGEGLIGGYVAATKGDDTLSVSFTVPVVEFEIDD